MNKFKKRTIALILASVVTVAGSFATENFKNTLMGIDFLYDTKGSGALCLVLQTQNSYHGNITPTKKDQNTYVLMLPEVNNKVKLPDISKYNGTVQNISINTLPYTTNGNGYTRIVIHTNNVPTMFGKNVLYIPKKEESSNSKNTYTQQKHQEIIKQQQEAKLEQIRQAREQAIQRQTGVSDNAKNYTKEEKEEELSVNHLAEQTNNEDTASQKDEQQEKINVNDVSRNDFEYTPQSKSSESIMLILGILLIMVCSVFFYTKAKNNLREIAGESLQLDLNDDENKKEKKTTKIKNAINKYDSKYTHKKVSVAQDYAKPEPQQTKEIKTIEEEINVVDLDELFKEKTISQNKEITTEEEEENLALEEFLSGFSFEDEIIVEPDNGYDVEFYEEVLKRQKLNFTDSDISKINKLLNTEISDVTLKDLEDFLVSNPIKRKRSKKEILEEFVTTYAISQNIVFSQDDIRALDKIMNVEIDQDFLKDLRTNPEITAKMTQSIIDSEGRSKKTTKDTVLKVKNMLPDLSEALKKQGNREIKSEAKPTTVYYSEGYDIKKLTVDIELPDLTKEINNKSAYASKPSASYDIVDNSYQVEKLSLTDELPDLKDALAHPEKYQKEDPKDVKVDEEALLNNILNVEFKPFYDGTQQFEIINKEDNIAISEDEGFLDLDKELRTNKPEPITPSENNIITTNKEKEEKRIYHQELKQINTKQASTSTSKADIKCILEGESYTVLSSVEFDKNKGCHLAKNGNGYVVLGYIGDRIFKIKEYEELKSEKIQARKNEDLGNGNIRFIIRIGINKFIVNVTENNIKYIMDLC